jgi:hypothetical protein
MDVRLEIYFSQPVFAKWRAISAAHWWSEIAICFRYRDRQDVEVCHAPVALSVYLRALRGHEKKFKNDENAKIGLNEIK